MSRFGIYRDMLRIEGTAFDINYMNNTLELLQKLGYIQVQKSNQKKGTSILARHTTRGREGLLVKGRVGAERSREGFN